MNRKRKAYRPGTTAINAVQLVIRATQRLSDEDRAHMRQCNDEAIATLQQGSTLGDEAAAALCVQAWRSLADSVNMAETFAGMGLGRGEQADELIEQAGAALAVMFNRCKASGTWSLEEAEREALQWLIELHCGVQLEAASYGEFQRAYVRTRNRIAQAAAGNAPQGTYVVSGDIGRMQGAVH